MPNRLIDETSPYLLQHANNPVDWYPWGPEALDRARAENKPILLSIGYSACHWCHVMERESFENEDIARLMNERFINIKVDREERPDLDAVYMEAVQMLTGSGGWPMTVFLTPDTRPFYGGTYFPPEDRHNMPGFPRLLSSISETYRNNPDEIERVSSQLADQMGGQIPEGYDQLSEDIMHQAYSALAANFDNQNGGTGTAPKFPQPMTLEFLLRFHQRGYPDLSKQALEMVDLTLEKMAYGGIYDQIGGGFHRYSTDAFWLVPHFEKMLYDNALLAKLYVNAFLVTRRPLYQRIAQETLDYVLREMTDPLGGFYSSQDADSEGVEGKFYVWSRQEFDAVLGSDAEVAAEFFGVTVDGNFEGTNILHRPTDQGWSEVVESARLRMLDERATRVRPGLDDKVVAAWNGLALRAFAEAGAALGEDRYLEAATDCAAFLAENLIVGDTLMRSWRDGRTSVPGFLDDYAAVSLGMFALFSATADDRWYDIGSRLTVVLAERFTDPAGGFFDTASDAEKLIKRPKSQADNPLPSGNGLAAEALLTLSGYTGDLELRDQAIDTLASAGLLMDRYPSMVGHHLAVSYSSGRMRELAVVGPKWAELAAPYWMRFRPGIVLAPSPTGEGPISVFAHRVSSGETLAYLCEQQLCKLPTGDAAELAAQLQAD